MPSKGGRRQTAGDAGSGGIAEVLSSAAQGPPDWAALGFSAADLARPLQRGSEVERFSELARRQDELTPEELDELYRYRLRRVQARLRRLDRVRAMEDEVEIRTALDDLDSRIEEVQRMDELRQAAGLPAGYEVDVSTRAAAVDRLLELSRRRVPGLIAGSDAAQRAANAANRIKNLFMPFSSEYQALITWLQHGSRLIVPSSGADRSARD